MDFNHTDDRRMLADMAERFVREQYPIETRHDVAQSENGFSADLWAQMAELGLIGALFSEENGGFGGAGFDLAVVFEALGRGLVVEPFLANLMAGTALATGNEQQKALLEQIISGEALCAFAHSEPASYYTLSHVEARAEKTDDGYILNGNKAVVLSGDCANHLVVSARTSGQSDDEGGIALFFIDAHAEGVHRRTYPTVDGYRAADIAFNNVSLSNDALIVPEEGGLEVIRKVISTATLAVSAEALGAIEVALDMTLDYLKTRKQFGVPIGKFQALQHRMADLMGEREQIRSALINAAGHLHTPERDWYISALKNLVGRSGRKIAEESIQMHGGIAMTWEYAVGHYAKRIVMIDHLFGDEDHHLAQIIEKGKVA